LNPDLLVFIKSELIISTIYKNKKFGRRLAFSATLVVAAIFMTAAAAAPDYLSLCFMVFMAGTGIGGNM